jgi:general secretion pathway protein A
LEQKLDSRELRQLKQRIALRCRLKALTEEQTARYIEERLKRAGASWTIFPDEAAARVYQYSHGIPRVINSVCESALISAYAQQLRSVTTGCIDEAAADFRLNQDPIEQVPDVPFSAIHAVPQRAQ